MIKRALITGVNGMDGSHLADFLLTKGYEVFVKPNQKIFCRGHIDLGHSRFHCWKKHGHGRVDLNTALQQSCDSYFYEIAQRVGIDRIAEMARRFGLGDLTGIDLPNEQGGLMPTTSWKKKNLGNRFQVQEKKYKKIGPNWHKVMI